MNRQMRRASNKIHSVQMRKSVFDEFQDMTGRMKQKLSNDGLYINSMKSFHANSIYSVSVYERYSCLLLGIRKKNQEVLTKWGDLQKIKNLIAGEDWTGYQIYPPENRLIDQAHMYWIFCEQGDMRFDLNNWKEELSGKVPIMDGNI